MSNALAHSEAHAPSKFFLLVEFGIVFLFVFGVRPSFLAGINAGQVLALPIIIYAFTMQNALPLARPLCSICGFLLILSTYHLVMAHVYGNDASFVLSICLAAVFSLIFGWAFAEVFLNRRRSPIASVESILIVFVCAVLLNAIIIIAEYFLPPLRVAIESAIYFNQNSNIDYLSHPFRLRGVAAAGGAALSLVHALAVVVAFELARLRAAPLWFALVSALVITVSNIFTGRTGLLISIIFMMFILMLLVLRWRESRWLAGITVVGVAFAAWFLLVGSGFSVSEHEQVLTWAFEWLGALDGDGVSTGSTDDLATMLYFPGDPVHYLFGVGFFEGYSSLYERSDSGYVKTLLSFGILLGLALYVVLLYLICTLQQVSRTLKPLACLLAITFFVCEIKEPFLYQNYAGRLLFMLAGISMWLVSRRATATQQAAT